MKEAKRIEAFSEANEHDGEVIDITSMTSKSSLNVQYLQEKNKIINEFGSLEEMRLKLGMTKSQISQLLLVKPATWSRWEKNEAKAPPHIFQALKWYLLLADAKPEVRTHSAPEFIYENHLKMIGSEIKKIKHDFDFKSELMNLFENKISSMITQGLTQIQVQIQPVIGQAPAFQLDESFKTEQFKLQSQVQNVEYLLRQMREDVSVIKTREPAHPPQPQTHYSPPKKHSPSTTSDEQVNPSAVALKVILAMLALVGFGVMAYFFVMYS